MVRLVHTHSNDSSSSSSGSSDSTNIEMDSSPHHADASNVLLTRTLYNICFCDYISLQFVCEHRVI
jgi:hypothetical protein